MGCGDKQRAAALEKVYQISVTGPQTKAPKVEDFHCADCGLTLKKRPVGFKHLCNQSYPNQLAYQTERESQCQACEFNHNNICTEYKRIYPDRDCRIDVGIKMALAACPLRKWDRRMIKCQQCDSVLFNPDREPLECGYCGWQNQRAMLPGPSEQRSTMPADCVVITAADKKFIRGAYFLAWTLLRSNDVRMRVYLDNVPKTDPHVVQMRSWGVETVPMPKDFGKKVFYSQTWNKPATIADALTDNSRVLWLDSDTAVTGSLTPVFQTISEHPFASGHGFVPPRNRNAEEIWELFGLPKQNFLSTDYPCAGIIGFQSGRDEPLIQEWRERCRVVVPLKTLWHQNRRSERESPLKFYDQGILQDLWEWPTSNGKQWSDFGVPRKGSIANIMEATFQDERGSIVHFGGQHKPFFDWPNTLDWGAPGE